MVSQRLPYAAPQITVRPVNKKIVSIVEILLANLFWGFGFLATTWALESFSFFQSLYLRFTLVTLVTLPFVFFQLSRHQFKQYFQISLFPALFILGEIFFQILGLKYTTPSKAAFITTLFIVMVPLLEIYFSKSQVSKWHWAWVLLSLLGTYLIVGGELAKISVGDLIILISAVFVSCHIIIIGKLSTTSLGLFKLNLFQSYWGFLITIPLMFFEPQLDFSQVKLISWAGLLALTFGTTMLAFYFQLRAQRTISASTASLLFLLESPIAAIFSYLLAGERLSWLQLVGCATVLFSATGVILSNTSKKPI